MSILYGLLMIRYSSLCPRRKPYIAPSFNPLNTDTIYFGHLSVRTTYTFSLSNHDILIGCWPQLTSRAKICTWHWWSILRGAILINQLETSVIILVNIFSFFKCLLAALKAERIGGNYILTYNQQVDSETTRSRKNNRMRWSPCSRNRKNALVKSLDLSFV